MQKLSKREILRRSHINTDECSATYFPFPEYTTQVAYSAGVYGCTGQMYRGLTSGCLYATDPYGAGRSGSPNREMVASFGNRERDIVERLDHVEIIENGVERNTLAFVAYSGERFTVTTTDFGRTWTICG